MNEVKQTNLSNIVEKKSYELKVLLLYELLINNLLYNENRVLTKTHDLLIGWRLTF